VALLNIPAELFSCRDFFAAQGWCRINSGIGAGFGVGVRLGASARQMTMPVSSEIC
jgi:hypothetical protein